MIDRVIFRKFRKGGDIIALLPDNPANPGMVDSYQHIGQHGEASRYLSDITVLAKPAEYADLLSELKSIGYKPALKKRMPILKY